MRLNGKEGDGGNGFSPETEQIDKSQIWRRARAQWQIHENSPTILLNISSHLNIPMSGWMLSPNRVFKILAAPSRVLFRQPNQTHIRVLWRKNHFYSNERSRIGNLIEFLPPQANSKKTCYFRMGPFALNTTFRVESNCNFFFFFFFFCIIVKEETYCRAIGNDVFFFIIFSIFSIFALHKPN